MYGWCDVYLDVLLYFWNVVDWRLDYYFLGVNFGIVVFYWVVWNGNLYYVCVGRVWCDVGEIVWRYCLFWLYCYYLCLFGEGEWVLCNGFVVDFEIW